MTRRDVGLQAERTLLAWRRTALGLLANAALLVAVDGHQRLRVVLAAIVCVLALGVWAAVSAVYRGALDPHSLGSPLAIRLVALTVMVTGLADVYIVVTH
jgi:uncharacterized membrane protein YidH (DUF202 family)